ncbi:hypothetical protein MJO28_002103 [Puccinia striiformis f. sp. tritici]|uniref:Uncharacterized protein n=2 Tax=Puccinia striiformis f. sp. tritici TaxID=168172 RepID=A0A0L0W348_9BASI|nr:hypothetical protein Pst134EB_003784 [Puccinia striiformis f. sp. tritici]KAI7961614.1 hypothetical protein MJO28_002103 [Puccinia striiformis f. sp. tritici]KAI9610107.1 hypothetical protein H4Q26_007105 [Puccinia striiformis f. sp. tritici PST-130]KNF05919.1 hypothetical protein PSTG_00911 [Puccinia striiformis f. sp. tritici PST-78]
MSSYQIEARPSSRDVMNSGLPPERRRFWAELPGWVTSYLQEKTEVRKTSATNAFVYDTLCTLWQVPESFGVATEEQTVYVITEASNRRDASRAGDSQRQALAQEVVQVIEFLAENSSAQTKRLGWLDPNLLEKLEDVSPSDWIVFPASDMIHWLSDKVSESAEKSMRHIPQHPPCRVCVFGQFNQPSVDPTSNNGQRKVSAGAMQLSQIWHHGFFVTFTSKAAASNIAGVRRLISKLIERRYDALENPTGHVDIQMWLSLHTYWLLSAPSVDEAQAPTNISIPSIRAFNEIHDPDLPPIPIINKDQMDTMIRSMLNDGQTSINLIKSDLLNQLKIPRAEIPRLLTLMSGCYDRREGRKDEVQRIRELASQLVKTFWMFRLALIVVSEEESARLRRSDQLPWCQFVSFDTLLEFIENNFGL